MSQHWRSLLLLVAVVAANGQRIALAQSQVPVLQEIRLPVPASRGSFGGGFLIPSVPAQKRFAVRLLPDQRLLVMNPNGTGQWSLTRIGKWWTESPEMESLVVPGWTSANVHREGGIETTVLVTPDGRYGVVVSGIDEVKNAGQIPFGPNSPIAGKPDTLITLVDLAHWQVVGGFHTATLGIALFKRAHIAAGKWIALQGYLPSTDKNSRRPGWLHQLISIPELTVGPSCITTEAWTITSSKGNRDAAEGELAKQNNAFCGDLLSASGLKSLHRFEALMYLGTDPPPDTYQPHKEFPRKFSNGTGPIDERNFNFREMVGRTVGLTPDDDHLYHDNPPFESPESYWYEFQHQQGTRVYQLAKYDRSGATLSVVPTTLLAREGCQRWYRCDCRVESVREESDSLLAYCYGFTLGFAEVEDPKAQWLTMFRTRNLSEIGDIRMSKDRKTKQALATANGGPYVLVVEQGEILRVYRVLVD
jgi:hypothetical protein